MNFVSSLAHHLALVSSTDNRFGDIFLEMPWFPGKLVLGALFLLSILAWGITIAKMLLLRRLNREDANFVKRLKHSRHVLEVFEYGEIYEGSPLFDVYSGGSKAAALEMIGNADPRFIYEHNLASTGCLKPNQFGRIDTGFAHGEGWAGLRIGQGFHSLRKITLLAPLLGVVGGGWLLFLALNSEEALFVKQVSYALVLIMVSLLVGIPSLISRYFLLRRYRRRMARTRRFREQISDIFFRHLSEPEKEPHIVSEPPAPHEAPSPVSALTREAGHYSAPSSPPKARETLRPAPTPLPWEQGGEHPLVAANRRHLETELEERSEEVKWKAHRNKAAALGTVPDSGSAPPHSYQGKRGLPKPDLIAAESKWTEPGAKKA